MVRRTLSAVALALLLTLAGCTGGVAPDATATPDDGTAGNAPATGTVNVYVSDEKNAIDQFAHLNVTITKVGLHRANASANVSESESGSANESESGSANESAWVERDVDNVTVDLTELRGANASKLGSLAAPNGTYDTVFIYVSAVDGVLDSGEEVNVKLPSSRLHVNENFTVGSGEEVDFVFDVSVFEAGKSGKYVLKPVVSQSGTGEDVEIRKRGDDESGPNNESNENGKPDDAGKPDDSGPDEDGSDETETTETETAGHVAR